MKSIVSAFLFGLILHSPVRGEEPVPPIATTEEKKTASEQWQAKLEKSGYQATFKAADGAPPLSAKPIAAGQFDLQQGELHIGIGFNKAPTLDTTLDELRGAFKYLSLDKIPVPGISDQAWEVILRTPTSSFKDGVKIESWEKGVMKLRVQTEFFAISGSRRDIQKNLPADAGMPQGSYFQIRKPLKADLQIIVRLLPEKLHP